MIYEIITDQRKEVITCKLLGAKFLQDCVKTCPILIPLKYENFIKIYYKNHNRKKN